MFPFKKFLIILIEDILIFFQTHELKILKCIIVCGAVTAIQLLYYTIRIYILEDERLSEFKDLLHPQISTKRQNFLVKRYRQDIRDTIFAYYIFVMIFLFYFGPLEYLLYVLHDILSSSL
jgi:hypothetical protein